MRMTTVKIKKINLLKKLKRKIKMRMLKKIVPYLIGFVVGVFASKSEAGKKWLNKIPGLGDGTNS